MTQIVSDGSALRGLFGFAKPFVIEIQQDSDKKQNGKRRSAIENIFKQFGRHTETSFLNTVATYKNDTPSSSDRVIQIKSSDNDDAFIAAGVMRINPNHPAARLVQRSDNTSKFTDPLSFIISDSTTTLQILSNVKALFSNFFPL